MLNKRICILLLIALLPALTLAQKKYKPWMEWSKKEAEKILNDSPWAQTQTETDTSSLFFQPQGRSAGTQTGGSSPSNLSVDTNQATSVRFRIRFLSAKPIRQAVARLMEFQQPDSANAIRSEMSGFVERQFTDWIAVAVTFDTREAAYAAPVQQAFKGAVTDMLKHRTYLERKDGKRLFLQIYQAPTEDGLGAKFIFARKYANGPFLNIESGEVRFVSEISKDLKLDRRFKVEDMVYDGKLEY